MNRELNAEEQETVRRFAWTVEEIPAEHLEVFLNYACDLMLERTRVNENGVQMYRVIPEQ